MELDLAIKTRRSIRRYQDREVPEDLILQAIELAGYAPSGGNYQPWRFVVIKNRALIRKLAQVFQERVDLIASWPEAAEFAETMERYRRNASFSGMPRSASLSLGVFIRVRLIRCFKRGYPLTPWPGS